MYLLVCSASEGSIKSPGAGVTNGCGAGKLNLGHLQEASAAANALDHWAISGASVNIYWATAMS